MLLYPTKKSLYGDNAEGFYLPFGELDDNGCGWQVFRTIKVNLLGKFVSISKDGETEGCTDFNTAQDIFWICKSENIPLKVDSGDGTEDDSAARMLSGGY